jgi:hypothetical protein
MIASKQYADWAREARAKRCAPPSWTFRETFHRYTPNRLIRDISLTTLLKVPDLFAHAESSGCEACYVEVARWSWIRNRWEKFAFVKCFGGEIKEFPDIGDVETCRKIADLINERQGRQPGAVVNCFPSFNSAVENNRLTKTSDAVN